MKILTLFVDHRVDHIVNFSNNGLATPSYILENNGQDIQNLFSFYHEVGGRNSDKSVVLQSDKKKKVFITSVTCLVSEDPEKGIEFLDVKFCLSTKAPSSNDVALDTPEAERLSINHSNDSEQWPVLLTASNHSGITQTCVNITFELKEDDKPACTSRLKLFVAMLESINDVVLDFGSEASQMTIFNRRYDQDISGICDIFSDVKSMVGIEDVSDADYVQRVGSQESGYDDQLYKSVFYARQTFGDELLRQLGNQIFPQEGATSEVLKILTSTQEAEDLLKTGFIRLPNVKISGFGGVPEPKVNGIAVSRYQDNYFYRASLNHFLLSALLSGSKNNCSCISLHVLMPNVYKQSDVYEHLKWMQLDVQAMIDNNETLNKRVRCVELSVISESDASLLGALAQIDRPERGETLSEGKYLILDAGKGTLDFSVLQVEKRPDKKYLSIYRSGIIGAGNALTYAYALALLHDYLIAVSSQEPTVDDLCRYIHANVLGFTEAGKRLEGGDAAMLHTLMQALDRYKVAVNTVGMEQDEQDESLTLQISRTTGTVDMMAIKADSFSAYVKSMVKDNRYRALSSNAQYYVNSMIKFISQQVCSNLALIRDVVLGGEVDGVLFAGRGFCHSQFKRTVLEDLANAKIIRSVQCERTFTGDNFSGTEKNICLYISTVMQRGQYNSQMMCMPKKCIFEEINDHADDHNGSMLYGLMGKIWKTKKGKKATKQEQKILEKFNKVQLILEGSGYDSGAYNPGDSKNNIMVEGYELDIRSADDRILLGGSFYEPSLKGQVRLFFTGDGVVLRNDTECRPLNLQTVNLETSALVFATMFPYMSALGINQVVANLHAVLDAVGECKPKQDASSPKDKPSHEDASNAEKVKQDVKTKGKEGSSYSSRADRILKDLED